MVSFDIMLMLSALPQTALVRTLLSFAAQLRCVNAVHTVPILLYGRIRGTCADAALASYTKTEMADNGNGSLRKQRMLADF